MACPCKFQPGDSDEKVRTYLRGVLAELRKSLCNQLIGLEKYPKGLGKFPTGLEEFLKGLDEF